MNIKKVKTGDVVTNGATPYLVLGQNSEDTLLFNTVTKTFIVAWGLQEDDTWNQGHFCETFELASEVYNRRHMENTTNYRDYLHIYDGNKTCAKMRLLLEENYRETYEKNYNSGGVMARKIKSGFETVVESIYDFSKTVT